MWNLKDLWNFHASHDCSLMSICFIYAFFLQQLFELSIFDLFSVLNCLLSLPSFSPWTLTPPPSCVIVFHRRRMTESASRFSHHTKPLVYCCFWFLTDVPRPDLHLLHISFQKSQVALCSSFCLCPGFDVAYERVLYLWCLLFFLMLAFLFGGPSSLLVLLIQASIHGLISHVSIHEHTWTFCTKFKSIDPQGSTLCYKENILYVGRLKIRLCELLQITGILNIVFIGVSGLMFLKTF